MSSAQSKVWFVTGASSGLGYSMTQYLLEQGNKVVATMRNPKAITGLAEQYSGEQLLVLKLDVTSPPDIKAAFAQSVEKFGSVDVVYSNAGWASVGEIEGTPDDIARRLFEVNFWGSVNVAREAFDVFRDVNKPQGGRFLQVSSVVGLAPAAGIGFYSSTKHAIEGLFQAWSTELHPSWNIKITLLEFGYFRTRALTPEGVTIVPVHPAYDREDVPTTGVRKYFGSGGGADDGSSPDKASREIYKIAVDDTVPLRIPLAFDAIKSIRDNLQSIKEDVNTSEKWSADLAYD